MWCCSGTPKISRPTRSSVSCCCFDFLILMWQYTHVANSHIGVYCHKFASLPFWIPLILDIDIDIIWYTKDIQRQVFGIFVLFVRHVTGVSFSIYQWWNDQLPLPTPSLSLRLYLTWASLCWLSASPGLAMALLVSSIRLADLSMTSPAQSSMAFRAGESSVVAATPLAAEAKDFRAWATSLAAMPGSNRRKESNLMSSTSIHL